MQVWRVVTARFSPFYSTVVQVKINVSLYYFGTNSHDQVKPLSKSFNVQSSFHACLKPKLSLNFVRVAEFHDFKWYFSGHATWNVILYDQSCADECQSKVWPLEFQSPIFFEIVDQVDGAIQF